MDVLLIVTMIMIIMNVLLIMNEWRWHEVQHWWVPAGQLEIWTISSSSSIHHHRRHRHHQVIIIVVIDIIIIIFDVSIILLIIYGPTDSPGSSSRNAYASQFRQKILSNFTFSHLLLLSSDTWRPKVYILKIWYLRILS